MFSTSTAPEYIGTSYIETYLYDADEQHPAAVKTVRGGSLYALVPGKAILVHSEPGNILHTYVQLNCSAEWIAGIDFTDANAATARIAAEFDGWAQDRR
ncbi:hypothetical protein [Paenibacillus chitinolyticus]|uniref:hypothetical protein n=1 Tax=Paenibacillus chitinolyticus TaxID=79263 RepID=UPI00366D10CD